MTGSGAPAPLIATPEAEPDRPQGRAEWFLGRDGARLRAAVFPATAPSRGTVVLSHGRTEAVEKYYEVIADLQARGFTVLTHDWRGQGFSGRFLHDGRGHARGWRLFVADFCRLLDSYGPELPRPWIAMGHSMGGALTLLALAEGETRFAGCILSAPMLGLYDVGRRERLARILAWGRTVVGQGGQLVAEHPTDPLDGEFEENVLTRDPVRFERWQAQLKGHPELQLFGVTWGWLAFALSVIYRIEQLHRLEQITIPVTIVAAGNDRICISAAAKAATARIPEGRYVEVEGASHEILMETDPVRDVFWSEFDALADRLAPRPRRQGVTHPVDESWTSR
ncbi:MAG: alpha/beta fold hydrolase [Caulobacteraceae bacterium]